MDNRLTHRATILREWMGTESYALVQAIFKEEYDKKIDDLLRGSRESFDHYAGVLTGLRFAMRVAEQIVLEEGRQRPREDAQRRAIHATPQGV